MMVGARLKSLPHWDDQSVSILEPTATRRLQTAQHAPTDWVSDYLQVDALFPATCASLVATPMSSEVQFRHREPDLSIAIRRASNAIATAALLYKELAVSASDLLRPSTYHP